MFKIPWNPEYFLRSCHNSKKRSLSQQFMRHLPDHTVVTYQNIHNILCECFHSSLLSTCLNWRLTKAVIMSITIILNWTTHSLPVLRQVSGLPNHTDATMTYSMSNMFLISSRGFFNFKSTRSGDYFSKETYCSGTTVNEPCLLSATIFYYNYVSEHFLREDWGSSACNGMRSPKTPSMEEDSSKQGLLGDSKPLPVSALDL